ncbi:MAG: Holliday junction DNA helicase RuvB [Candidatus Nealsonbacteria bacterium RIFOXYB1_FULL_40_15]|uniref:Holliday junction branch migration complex subunit RuvB n=2 Tax=Candidatus Nealsoniibacteriota TaxID=1817911 RepID=A0A1G2ETJ0_9BACT|nr:MAG: Holliday junction DNA helicase RuvB [Candidatus Nealsonbacteria bacterium RIFOXYB1_FULL_40_15]OGZ29165.1 MAG: Holliday junction DNA helicase RuvB [Candidatus Nealsonbacteria bacterium RIFOXYC1_FULL_40_7]OGZ29717.1 MAG: Holliday junction DNA helicase RuvB [Candidatus Nealsonbacteria bacterium RIFOXYD1_FULL_39_11]
MSRVLEKSSESIDSALRPKNWDEYFGQEKIKRNLRVIIEAAKKRSESIEHILFYGGSGLGKTTISQIIAREMGKEIRIIAGPTLEKVGDLAAILTSLSEGSILFIDECHRINRVVEEFLYPAMEDFKLHLVLGKGPMARTMDLDLPRFTLIGATTRLAMLSSPLRNRFGAVFQLDYYNKEDIEKIIERSGGILGIGIEKPALSIIARSSRFTPRVANRLVKRIRDFAQVEGKTTITLEMAEKSLELLEIDKVGLEPSDRKILSAIIEKFEGGPVGLQTLSASTNEEKDAILDIYEPYLMQIGFLERTPKGRTATKSAYEHLGLIPPRLI